MGEVSTIGLDIAKSVFQVHGVDGLGVVVIRKRVSRAKMLEFFAGLPRCLIGIEACPAAHHWARELQAIGPPRVRQLHRQIFHRFRRRPHSHPVQERAPPCLWNGLIGCRQNRR